MSDYRYRQQNADHLGSSGFAYRKQNAVSEVARPWVTSDPGAMEPAKGIMVAAGPAPGLA